MQDQSLAAILPDTERNPNKRKQTDEGGREGEGGGFYGSEEAAGGEEARSRARWRMVFWEAMAPMRW